MKFNFKDSCKYHEGKLKFYSCLSCGADQYYDCCNKCIKCEIGCKKSPHMRVEKPD